MTLAWQSTSQKKSQTRLPIGAREKPGSFLDWRMRLRIGPNLRQNMAAEATIKATRSNFSHVEKLCGSASVAVRKSIYELTHDTRSGPWATGWRVGRVGRGPESWLKSGNAEKQILRSPPPNLLQIA